MSLLQFFLRFPRNSVTTAGLSKPKDNPPAGRDHVTMSESRQLSVIKRRHMAVLVTLTFLVYSTVSTVVFQARICGNTINICRL